MPKSSTPLTTQIDFFESSSTSCYNNITTILTRTDFSEKTQITQILLIASTLGVAKVSTFENSRVSGLESEKVETFETFETFETSEKYMENCPFLQAFQRFSCYFRHFTDNSILQIAKIYYESQKSFMKYKFSIFSFKFREGSSYTDFV